MQEQILAYKRKTRNKKLFCFFCGELGQLKFLECHWPFTLASTQFNNIIDIFFFSIDVLWSITMSDFDYASTWEFNLIYHPRELEYVKKPELIVTTRNFVFFFLMMNWHTNTNIQFNIFNSRITENKMYSCIFRKIHVCYVSLWSYMPKLTCSGRWEGWEPIMESNWL